MNLKDLSWKKTVYSDKLTKFVEYYVIRSTGSFFKSTAVMAQCFLDIRCFDMFSNY